LQWQFGIICGKTILLEQIEEEFVSSGFDKTHIIRINFEDLQFEKYSGKCWKRILW